MQRTHPYLYMRYARKIGIVRPRREGGVVGQGEAGGGKRRLAAVTAGLGTFRGRFLEGGVRALGKVTGQLNMG